MRVRYKTVWEDMCAWGYAGIHRYCAHSETGIGYRASNYMVTWDLGGHQLFSLGIMDYNKRFPNEG